jgi:hypothetical protein
MPHYAGLLYSGTIYVPYTRSNGYYMAVTVNNYEQKFYGQTIKVTFDDSLLWLECSQTFVPNLYTAGNGITIKNGTISATSNAVEYLTNSDVLTIWNGNNE